jgi:hypothetical protein
VLEGDRLVNTPYQIKFRVDVDNAELCKKKLNSKELQQFRDAVKNDYYFQASTGRAGCSAKGGSMELLQTFPRHTFCPPVFRHANAWLLQPVNGAAPGSKLVVVMETNSMSFHCTCRCTTMTSQFGDSLARLRRWSALGSTSGWLCWQTAVAVFISYALR